MGTYAEQYMYDSVGNFLTLIHKGSDPTNPGWSRSYTYNEPSLLNSSEVSNRLSSSAVSGGPPLTEPYTYDPHGNMTSMPQLQQMQWDFLDHLGMTRRQAVNTSDSEGILDQGQQTYYVYSASGERVRKITVSGSGATLCERFYLGGYEIYRSYGPQNSVTLERHTLHVMDDNQRVALVETVTVNAKASAVTLPVTTSRYQFGNHLGSACLELDETGAVITYEEYYPYGSTSYQAGTTTTETSLKRYRYTGKERDQETGLEYHSARYYAPWLGRWTACDPKGTERGASLYAYVSGQPTRLTDPSGRDGWDRFLGGVKAVGGGLETWAGGTLVAAGVATGWTGVGLLLVGAGAVVTAHGIDTIQAGVRTVITGQPVDTFTSQKLQSAGLTRRQANLVDAAIGVVGTLGATAAAKAPSIVAAARTGSEANALAHLTSAEGKAAIEATQTLGKGAGTVYAGPASLADSSTVGRVLRTGLGPSKVTDVVNIPNAAADAFRVPVVVGPMTAWQRVWGTVYSAGAGSIDLAKATDAFTRTGPAWNQGVIYGIDAVANFAGRSAATARNWFDWGPNAKAGSIEPALKLQISPATTVKFGTVAPSGAPTGPQPDNSAIPFGRDELSSQPQASGVGATVSW